MDLSNCYLQLRTPAIRKGDAQVGFITMGSYFKCFGELMERGAMPTETASELMFKYADYLVVIDNELRHASFGEMEMIGRDNLTRISVSDILGAPQVKPVDHDDVSDYAEAYSQYQNVMKMIHEGRASASEAARALSYWKNCHAKLNAKAEALIGEVQMDFALEGGEMGDGNDS